MPLIIPGSEVPIPGPHDGFLYGEVHAEKIAANLRALRRTYREWDAHDAVPEPESTLPEVLGIGRYSTVERVGNYARRSPCPESDTELYARNLVRGIGGHPRLEQIRAVSRRYTYSDILSGTARSFCTDEDIAALERKELIDTGLDALTVMQARGLRIERGGDNVLVDQVDSIGIVDYDVDPRQPLHVKVAHIALKVIVRSGLTETHPSISKIFRPDVANRLPALIRLNEQVQKRAQIAPDFWGPSARSTQKILDRVQYNLAHYSRRIPAKSTARTKQL